MVASSKRAEDYLQRDQNILVKIIKEPISAKGSRISTDISLAGRFMVLVPMADYVAVSKKIESSKERRRLRSLASSLRPEGFGIIVRTVADGRDAKALDTDLRLLLDKWRSIEKQLRDKVKPPAALYEDVNMVSSIIRDLFTDDFDRILIDDPKLYRNVKGYIEAVAPQMAKNVQLYKGRQGIFRSASIERSVEEAFSPRVNMKSGGYLFIEHTEAMHVVDVNSGRAGRGKSQAQNLLDVNLEAAREIAKQLRLRDLGGIICVDFIDMRLDSHRRRLYDTLKQEFRKDRAVTKLLPMSDFGVVQITRQRLRPSITADGDGQNGQEAAGAGEIVQSDRTRREIDRIA
ncbi:MAG: Rne/Rng family ribonuclease, partial [Bacteroidota bacterium]